MSTDNRTSALEDVWIQVFALMLIVSGVFSLHYMLRPGQAAQAGALPGPRPAQAGALAALPLPSQPGSSPLAAGEPLRPQSPAAPVPAVTAAPKTPGRLVVAPDGAQGAGYSSLGEAVAKASDGDTIVLRPGKYEVSVLTAKSLTISGGGASPDDVVLTNSINPTFAIDGGRMVMENMTIANTSRVDYWALSAERASLILRNVNVKSSVKGIKVQGSDLEASDCDIESTAGLAVSGRSKVKLSGVSVTGSIIGISVEDQAANVQVEGSHISGGGGAGLRAAEGAWVKINGTTISGNRYAGIIVGDGAEIRVTKSQITDNGECGAYIEENGKLVLEKVSLTRNKCGVGFAGAGSLEARGSKFSDNSMGAVAVSPLEGGKAIITGGGNTGLLVPGEKRTPARKRGPANAEEGTDAGSEE